MKTKSKNKNFISFIKFLFQINLISCINSNKENKNIPGVEDNIDKENKNIPGAEDNIDKKNKNIPKTEYISDSEIKEILKNNEKYGKKKIIVNCESGSFCIGPSKIEKKEEFCVFALIKEGSLQLKNRDFFYEFYTTDKSSLKDFYIYTDPEIKFFFILLYTKDVPIIIYYLKDKSKINFEKFTIVNIDLEERAKSAGLIEYLSTIAVDSIKILENFLNEFKNSLEDIKQNRQSSISDFGIVYYYNFDHLCRNFEEVYELTEKIKMEMKRIEEEIGIEEEEGYDFKLYYINQLKNLEENFDTINNLNKEIEKKNLNIKDICLWIRKIKKLKNFFECKEKNYKNRCKNMNLLNCLNGCSFSFFNFVCVLLLLNTYECPIENISEFFSHFKINEDEEGKFITKGEEINEFFKNLRDRENRGINKENKLITESSKGKSTNENQENIFKSIVDEEFLFPSIKSEEYPNKTKYREFYEKIKNFIDSNFRNVDITLLYRGGDIPNGVKDFFEIKGLVSTSKYLDRALAFYVNHLFIFILKPTCSFNYLLDLNKFDFSFFPRENEVIIIPTIKLFFEKKESFVICYNQNSVEKSCNVSILVMVDPENIDSIDFTKDNTTTLPIDISTGIFKIKTL